MDFDKPTTQPTGFRHYGLAAFVLLVTMVPALPVFGDWPLAEIGVMTITPAERKVNLADRVYYLHDETGELTIEDIAQPDRAPDFAPNSGLSVNLGFTRAPVWLRFTLHNDLAEPTDWVLEIRNPRLALAELYAPTEDAGYMVKSAGTELSFYAREIMHPHPSFTITLPPGRTCTYYLRLRLSGSMRFRLTLWQAAVFRGHMAALSLLVNLHIGILLTMALYNLVIFFGLRERGYLYYTLLILLFLLYQMAFNGTAIKYLWPNSSWWADRSVTVLFTLTVAVAMLFARAFLHGAIYAPRWAKAAVVIAAASAAVTVLSFFDTVWKYPLSHFLAVASALVALFMSIQCVRRGYRPARLFLVAWSVVIVGTGVLGLVGPGILPSTMVTENLLTVGFVAAVMILSMALANRVKVQEEENRRILEETVVERTGDLRKAMAEMKTLSGLLPICSHCKKIRDDKGYWENVETYVSQRTDAGFSHSLCPDCLKELYPEYAQRREERQPSAEPSTP